jgi:hypothetical protein
MQILSNLSGRKRIVAAAAVVAFVPTGGAFVTPSGLLAARHATVVPTTISPTSLVASTLENPSIAATNSTSLGSSITASHNANAAVSDAVSTAPPPRKSLDVRIHGVWYDLTGT